MATLKNTDKVTKAFDQFTDAYNTVLQSIDDWLAEARVTVPISSTRNNMLSELEAELDDAEDSGNLDMLEEVFKRTVRDFERL